MQETTYIIELSLSQARLLSDQLRKDVANSFMKATSPSTIAKLEETRQAIDKQTKLYDDDWWAQRNG